LVLPEAVNDADAPALKSPVSAALVVMRRSFCVPRENSRVRESEREGEGEGGEGELERAGVRARVRS
jgi:hypothetical protein